jgi:hypothetical protein
LASFDALADVCGALQQFTVDAKAQSRFNAGAYFT